MFLQKTVWTPSAIPILVLWFQQLFLLLNAHTPVRATSSIAEYVYEPMTPANRLLVRKLLTLTTPCYH